MSFLDIIRRHGKRADETLDALKNDGQPLFLWGCGSVADHVYGFLEKNNIKLAGVFVDIAVSNRMFHGLPVSGLEEICCKYPSFNVIAGHAGGYRFMDAFKNNVKNIDRVYAIDDMEALFGAVTIDHEFISHNVDSFEWTYGQLSDELSKQSFLAYLNAKVNNSYKEISAFTCDNDYFCDDIISLTPDEIFVDCGAFNGDSIRAFIKNLNDRSIFGYRRIYAFEPDEATYSELLKLTKEMRNLRCLNKGAWNEQTVLRFKTENAMSSSISNCGDALIEVDTIDNVLRGGGGGQRPS
jgi:hypothetical protein